MNDFFKTMEVIYSNKMKEYIANKSRIKITPEDISIVGVSLGENKRCIMVEYKVYDINSTMTKMIPEAILNLLELQHKFSDSTKYIILSAHTRANDKWQFWTDEDYTSDVNLAGLYSKEYVDNLLGVTVCETNLEFEIVLNRNKYISTDCGQLVLDTDTAIPASLITTILGKEQTVIFV